MPDRRTMLTGRCSTGSVHHLDLLYDRGTGTVEFYDEYSRVWAAPLLDVLLWWSGASDGRLFDLGDGMYPWHADFPIAELVSLIQLT